MATYFVFGHAPSVIDLLDFNRKFEILNEPIKIEDAEYKSQHYLLNIKHFILIINGHLAGAQIDYSGTITAIYAINEDEEGVILLSKLIIRWSEENSNEEDELATLVIDTEMSNCLHVI